jgi:hypothetical protein
MTTSHPLVTAAVASFGHIDRGSRCYRLAVRRVATARDRRVGRVRAVARRQRSPAGAELRACLVAVTVASRRRTTRSQWLNLACLWALLSFGDRVAHPLSLVQALVAGTLDGREMYKEVITAALWADEPIALVGVEPFDRAFWHALSNLETHECRATQCEKFQPDWVRGATLADASARRRHRGDGGGLRSADQPTRWWLLGRGTTRR